MLGSKFVKKLRKPCNASFVGTTFVTAFAEYSAHWAPQVLRPGASERLYRYCASGPVAACPGATAYACSTAPGPDDGMSSIVLEPRCATGTAVLCAQHDKKNWYLRLNSVMHADAIMDRVVSRAL